MSHVLSLVFVSLLLGVLTHSTPVNAALPLTITNADVANVTNTTALVSWQTNRESTSTATYSQSPCPCPQGVGDPPERLVTQHSVALSGLSTDRDYYVQPVSVDRDGVRADGPVIQFRTLRDTALPPVEISSVEINSITADAAAVTWKTNIGVRGGSGVEYGTSPCPCAANVQVDLGTATTHRVELAPLTPNTTYYLRPFSYHPKNSSIIQYGPQKTVTTESGNPAASTSMTIHLLSPNGGQRWNQGEQHLLAWKISPGFVNALRVSLLNDKNERTTLVPQLTVEQRANGSTSLLIPTSLPSGTYTLEIVNAANLEDADTSDSTLTIGTVPKPEPLPVATIPPPETPAPVTFNPAPSAPTTSPSPTIPLAQEKTTSAPTPPPAVKNPASTKPKVKPKKKAVKKLKAKVKSKAKPTKKPLPKKAPVKK